MNKKDKIDRTFNLLKLLTENKVESHQWGVVENVNALEYFGAEPHATFLEGRCLYSYVQLKDGLPPDYLLRNYRGEICVYSIC